MTTQRTSRTNAPQSTHCSASTRNGNPCRAAPIAGKDYCPWHDPTSEGKARHLSSSARGGLSKAYGALAAVNPLSESSGVPALDLATTTGIKGLLAEAMHSLARLPFDIRTAYAIVQLGTIQRGIIESSDLEERVQAIEARLRSKR